MMNKFDRHIKRKVDISVDIYCSLYQLLLFKLHLAHKIFIIFVRVYLNLSWDTLSWWKNSWILG